MAGLTAAPAAGTAYWQFPVYVDETVAGSNGHRYGEALRAEGIPANGGYIQRPLYLTPLFTEKRTYGTSGYPLTLPTAPQYAEGLCPRTEELIIGGRLLVISWNEHYTADDVADIAAAVRKVHAAFTS